MGTIKAYLFSTLDGVVENPGAWHMPYFNDEMAQAMGEMTSSAAAVLMGRVLHDEWAAYWPANEQADEFGPFIMNIDKYVVSTTLTESPWRGTTVLTGDDPAGQVRALKERTDGPIVMSGSATTVRWLLAEGLLDELHLMVDPVAVGEGARLFQDAQRTPLRLVRHEAFETGVLHLVYAPAAA